MSRADLTRDSANPPSPDDAPWLDVREHALALAAALRALDTVPADARSAGAAYANIVDEISRWAEGRGAGPACSRPYALHGPKQLQAFGRLLRDKRNQAGLSRMQLARKAKLSDATIKFIETARHPPSRATLLRLIGVPELGLRWSDTPGYHAQPPPADLAGGESLIAAELHRFDARLSLPMVLESLLVLDELRACLGLIEITAHGARRACCVCGMRSDAWAIDAGEAAKLPIRHAAPCAGPLVDSLCQRHPVIAELAQDARHSLDSPTAAQIEASRRAAQVERFHGCRSGREVAALLASVAAVPVTPYRQGVSALLVWAMALGPCPVEPITEAFSERRAQQIADLDIKRSSLSSRDAARLRGVSDAAAWLVSPTAPPPGDPVPGPPDPLPSLCDSEGAPHVRA